MSTDSASSNLPQILTFRTSVTIRMSPEERALYERVALLTGPALVTRAEKNQLMGFHHQTKKIDYVGLTMAELKDKVAVSHVTLTREEADIILFGVTKTSGDLQSGKRDLLWSMDLVEEEQQLVRKVNIFLSNPYDNAIHRLTSKRWDELSQLDEPARKQRLEQKRQEMRAAWAAQRKAGRPKWVQEFIDAKLPHWGFVVFQTDYRQGTEEKWHTFKGIYRMTAATVLRNSWIGTNSLITTQKSFLVSDTELSGASLDLLRERFKAMRQNGEILSGRATDCFLVVDEAVLDNNIISTKTLFKPKSPGDPDPWQSTLAIRAVDPDHNNIDMSEFPGYITIPLPKVFDWLYYSLILRSENWGTRYLNTKTGPAEPMDTGAPYPAYRPGTEPPSV
ncbi:hypothetical protein BHYA_0060g00400 [Botrytis hyacinthi]|uniref:Uncharacterized protein n=1 Tax=Botrytis hyacinthi TaxID=278943 RepID=A0A4Z1H0Z2_9HELO|nr:hypothetical protein BHYA_0060g00400 [Botrytis hyacinthi]